MITLSLLLNLAVLIPVCIGLIANAAWARASYGDATPARGILLSVYLSIALASAVLLVLRDPTSVVMLLALQVIYKLTTPFTVGTLRHPVVVSNLGIAAFHSMTLLAVWRTIGIPLAE